VVAIPTGFIAALVVTAPISGGPPAKFAVQTVLRCGKPLRHS
jgi:hypothetical protein